ncbi:MAG: type II toxin-antitoxin system RelE/ParE family toxin [Acidaminococcaceae bacterium]|jgi:addiction module RelE/StbE family toxin|nr:type II toxin-antitoxin system RelE/ParE family toxin [Acidaminococcaceae bacterium]MBO6264612.1 type II toxin-antitoxin system RelE/ParE family toxin [Acidaminococcaceae bacterium]MBP3264292.1 type II toxin-antitoxin system RelE/ParE family toxin [Acidaminococcaceae bacterium]MBQ5345512.1 type II toxin-antitoxin system RelE/ParE family toxin [Acidaminococcaceae bacterium]
MILRYSPEALSDLAAIKKYIEEDLGSPIAAENIVTNITASCSLLKEQPRLGMELSKLIGRETDYRYLISRKYVIFYRIEGSSISIYRIIDARTDYIRNIGLIDT